MSIYFAFDQAVEIDTISLLKQLNKSILILENGYESSH